MHFGKNSNQDTGKHGSGSAYETNPGNAYGQTNAGGHQTGQGQYATQTGGAPLNPSGGQGAPGYDMRGTSGITAIEKQIKWRIVFFVGACCVFGSGVIALVYFILNLFNASTWSPCGFTGDVFLTLFGVLMMVLDAPLQQPDKRLTDIRESIYNYALFMTRFTGRGVWYLFLGSQVWIALFDESVCRIAAIIFAIYLVLLGLAGLVKGILLSLSLQSVRDEIIKDKQMEQRVLESMRNKNMNRDEFKNMLAMVTSKPDLFTDDEVGYVMNALSFRADTSDVDVSFEEMSYWLSPGPWVLV